MVSTRKENRPGGPAREGSPRRPHRAFFRTWGRRASQAGSTRGLRSGGRGGGKAPFISRASAPTLLILPLLTLLFFSFHPLSSPAAAAGEVAPSFRWPARGEVTCPFRPSQGAYGEGGHAGIDIAVGRGSEVRASAAGTVGFAGGTPLGLCVSIYHADGFKTTYVSLGTVAVRRGQEVRAGEVVGTSDGARDRSSASPHVHFGIFLNGIAVDPLPLLRGDLLDPGKSLFLGPWEDRGAVDAYFSRHRDGGNFGWLSRGLKWVGRTVADACKTVAAAAGKALSAAWRWSCRAARAVGGAFVAFYRACIAPWLVPLWRGVVEVARAALCNRYVQAVLAGLAAALVICLAVVGIALALGLSLIAAVTAAVVGSLAAIGYSIYYAFAAGDSFSFGGCFLASLSVGAAAAGTCLLLSYLAPLIGSGWASIGLLGFGKAFLVHGCADALVYIVFCLATGREVSPMGVLASFLIGGVTGGVGKLVNAGLLCGEAAQALTAGWLSSGGALLTGEGAAAVSAYVWAVTTNLAYKAAYVILCGLSSFLGDVIIRAVSGVTPSLKESLLCFGGGALAGAFHVAAGGEGLSRLVSRLSGGRLRLTSDLAKALVSKSLSRGFKEGSTRLVRWLRRREAETRRSLWELEMGGEM